MTMPIKESTKTPKNSAFLKRISQDFPDFSFVEGGQFSWHSGKKQILHKHIDDHDDRSKWALLHEIGHALLAHEDFKTDIELILKEVDAWAKAHELAAKYGLTIDQDYVEDNLDSYRDWLHLRSTCPTCFERCLQANKRTYRCHNCKAQWQVTRSRLCRPYRRKAK